MNERIKQLVSQATERQTPHASDMGDWKVIEKFADLMIQECSVALNPMLRDMISRGQAVDLIKQHFGVK